MKRKFLYTTVKDPRKFLYTTVKDPCQRSGWKYNTEKDRFDYTRPAEQTERNKRKYYLTKAEYENIISSLTVEKEKKLENR